MPESDYLTAFEAGLARLVALFQRAPDLAVTAEDLGAVALAAMWTQEALMPEGPTAHRTRDGRHTALVHVCPGRDATLALLDGAYLRSQPLDRVGQLLDDPWRQPAPSEIASWRDRGRPPLACLARLLLLDRTDRDATERVQEGWRALYRVQTIADRRYLVVFIRQWDVAAPVRLLEVMRAAAQREGDVSAVLVQSYADEVGRVSGGRYLNVWQVTAPMPPLPGEASTSAP